MSKNKYDAIIVRTPELGLTRDQYILLLETLRDDYVTIVENPLSEINCILFITEALDSHFDYDTDSFINHYKSILLNISETYDGTLVIDDCAYLIQVQ
jgi:hypothetical protein